MLRMLYLYDKAIVAIANYLDRQRSFSVAAISLLTGLYLLDLFLQINLFIKANGNFTSTEFLTERTVVPWTLFVLMGLFAGPFLASALFKKPRFEVLKGEISRSYENGKAIQIFFTVLMFLFTPYGILTVAAYYVPPCSGEELAACRRIQNGEAPAVVFKTTNIQLIGEELVKCGKCLNIDVSGLQKQLNKSK